MIKKLAALIVAFAWLITFVATAAVVGRRAAQDAVEAMIERLIVQDKLTGDRALYFRKLTSLLFDYLQATVNGQSLEALCRAETAPGLGRLLEKHTGQSVLDFGEKMFAFFESRAAQVEAVDLKTWKTAETDHFAFYFRQGSQAEKDLDLIKKSAEEAYAAVVSCLGLETEIHRTFVILKTDAPPGLFEAAGRPETSRISVYLYPARSDGAQALKGSPGNMSFGATIVPKAGEQKGAGRLTARINVLYFNLFSLTILHHEIGHSALFLGHFDPTALASRPLAGEAELKKVFFAGYRPIPPFLHEGVGDYAVYFQTFYNYWPLLPPPSSLVLALQGTKNYIGLETLLREGVRFRAQHHKAYSLEAASVVDYLIRTCGREKLKAWFLAPEPDSREAFRKIYGFTVKELEKKWTEDLKKGA